MEEDCAGGEVTGETSSIGESEGDIKDDRRAGCGRGGGGGRGRETMVGLDFARGEVTGETSSIGESERAIKDNRWAGLGGIALRTGCLGWVT